MTLQTEVARAAQRAPSPATVLHLHGEPPSKMVCHTAAIYWTIQGLSRWDRTVGLWQQLGLHQQVPPCSPNFLFRSPPATGAAATRWFQRVNLARAWASAINQSTCPGCTGSIPGKHPSVDHEQYGAIFGPHARGPRAHPQRPYADGNEVLADPDLEPGDIILLGPTRRPGHSMVCVSKTTQDVMIRGFNNANTFGVHHLAYMYDPTNRSISSPDLWHVDAATGEGRFGATGQPLWRIPCDDFARAILETMVRIRRSTI